MDIFAVYGTDETLENEGTWVPHGDARFLIARSGNRKYVKLLSTKVEQNQKLLDMKDEASDKLWTKISIDVMVESVLLGWENVAFKGATLDYTPDNARTLLGVKDFRDIVSKWASDINNFKSVLAVEQLGNSPSI